MKYGLFASLFLCLLVVFPACRPGQQNSGNRSTEVNRRPLSDWIIEDESDSVSFTFMQDTMEIVSPDGLTLWYSHKLPKNYRISYAVSIRMDGRPGDRLADMNCFWGASDPKHPHSFFTASEQRHGVFKNYNALNLYYVGYGGNDNTTTRFRKYHGDFYGKNDAKIKPLIREYTDSEHLLKPNKWYYIVITMSDGVTTFSVDGEELFRLKDETPHEEGYFGLRFLTNRAWIADFSVEPFK